MEMKKLKTNANNQLTEDEQLGVDTELFPKHNTVDWGAQESKEEEGAQTPNFTEEEVLEAGRNIKSKRAPRLDGIPPEAVKMMVKHKPEEVADIMSALLKKRISPTRWKRGMLLELEK